MFGEENENKDAEMIDAAVESTELSTERKPLTDVNYPDHKWYVINANSGMEYKAKLSLEERVRSLAIKEAVDKWLAELRAKHYVEYR